MNRDEKAYKIVVAHPGKQHSFQLAIALKRSGMLYKYITTVYDKPDSLTGRVKKLLKGKIKNKANTRKSRELDDDEVLQFDELKALILIMISKLPQSDSLWKKLNGMLADSFGKKVARYAIENNVDAVICFDSNCTVLFDILKRKAPHIKRIMDVSIANRLYMKEQFIEDIERSGQDEIREEQKYLWNENNCKRFEAEIRDSQFFIVASNIVKDSLKFSGVKETQIGVVPYGVDLTKFTFVNKDVLKKPLKLIYVGQVTYRKGIHHLLKVMETFSKEDVILKIAGGYSKDSKLYQKYKNMPNIEFLGFVTRDRLAKEYQSADVFVFPTLGEGYGLVVLEAMSCGVPVISSDHAGGNDAITPYEDGLVFKAGDDDELRKSIQWFIDHPDRLPELSRNAHIKSLSFSWEKYYSNVARLVRRWMEE